MIAAVNDSELASLLIKFLSHTRFVCNRRVTRIEDYVLFSFIVPSFQFQLDTVVRLQYDFSFDDDFEAGLEGDLKVPENLRHDALHLQHGELLSDAVTRAGTERQISEGVHGRKVVQLKSLRNEFQRLVPDFVALTHNQGRHKNIRAFRQKFSIWKSLVKFDV